MPQFSYTALDRDGHKKEGTVNAESVLTARDALKELSLDPQDIRETVGADTPVPWELTEESLTPEKAESLLSAVGSIPTDERRNAATHSSSPSVAAYFPLIDTLRLYAGWLLAWYFLVYALGSFKYTRSVPFDIPFLEGLFLSPLVLSFTLAAWLFLLLTGIWKHREGTWKSGVLYIIIGIGVFLLYRMNVA